MQKIFKKYFISHEGNHYRPHLLRTTAAHFLILLVVAAFIGSFAMQALADNSGLTPTILPEVLVSLTNQDRSAQNLSLLDTNAKLVNAATMKSEDMAEYQYFAHTSPAGVSPWAWFQKAGYKFLYAGENLAINFTQTQDVETAWMNSPEHKANILSKNFSEIGIAATSGTYQGHPTIYVVQLFGAPAVSVPPTQSSAAPAAILPATAAGNAAPLAAATKNTAPVSPQVKGASTQTTVPAPVPLAPAVAQAAEEPTKIITENPAAIQVQSADPTLVPTDSPSTAAAQTISWEERFFLDPSILLKIIYLAVGIAVLFALVMHAVVEIEHRHTPSLVYGSMILVLMGGLYLVSMHFFGTSVVFG